MARLRTPDIGCPWDLEQSFQTIAPFTVEEAYEVLDAIARTDMDDLKEELGDLLLQVVFHSRMAEEQGLFHFGDVINSIANKLIRRHPHIFPASNDDFLSPISRAPHARSSHPNWEEIKRRERAQKNASSDNSEIEDITAGIASGLAPLIEARKLQLLAAQMGYDWDDKYDVIKKSDEELAEFAQAAKADGDRSGKHADERQKKQIEEEFGDLIFTIVNLGRHFQLDVEQALKTANRKFRHRLRYINDMAEAKGYDLAVMAPELRDNLWEQAKQDEADKRLDE